LPGDTNLLFATPVLVEEVREPDLAKELEEVILARRAEHPGLQRSNVGGWHSDDGFLQWGGEPARRLLDKVFELANSATVAKGADTAFKWFAQGWANVIEAGASNAPHVHPGCFWSAVFYVRVDRGTGGELILRDPRSPTMEMHAPSLWFANAGVQREGSIKPAEGMLVLFPSWINHWVTPWHGNGLRISVAINLSAKPA